MPAVAEVSPARALDIRSIASRMRQADVDEVMASSGRSPEAALSFSYRKSSLRMTGSLHGKPEVMFGVGDLNVLARVGAPWLLATDAVTENPVPFLRASIEWRGQLLARYSILRNFVDARNTVSIRWLKWLGFEILDPIDVRGHKFHLFEMRA